MQTFYEKELQKTNQKEFRVEKLIKRKGRSYMLNGKARIVLLTVGLIKRHSINERIFSRTKIFRRKNESCIRFIYATNSD